MWHARGLGVHSISLGPWGRLGESGGVSACTVMSVDYLRRRNLVLGRTYFARFRPVLRGHRFRFEFRKMLTLANRRLVC